ncbi:hypothetical protein RHMOL_Rhmol01G0275600 [Rhododendron molle]|uniref:Uncharacterized protein n=1 Tax=Rhododendron molle TaxID=49168 RepID=A0ACC0Q9K7_RHOML|nr:hypothetical protein RHMOL_Rhmol01G0275600 [Rhododendron molle]
MKDSRVLDYAHMMSTLQYRKLNFEEFCAAAISVHQLEGMEGWEQHSRSAHELFEKDENKPIMIEELASELGLSLSVPVHIVLQDWIRQADGKLSFLGFVRLLHGVSSRDEDEDEAEDEAEDEERFSSPAIVSGDSPDTVTGFLLAGVGNVDLRRKTNYLIVDSKTTVKQIEEAFKEFTTREDIAIVMISQYVANMIRFLVDSYNNPVPAILEIPSKDHPYDPTHDSVLSRVKYLFSAESVASGRR